MSWIPWRWRERLFILILTLAMVPSDSRTCQTLRSEGNPLAAVCGLTGR